MALSETDRADLVRIRADLHHLITAERFEVDDWETSAEVWDRLDRIVAELRVMAHSEAVKAGTGLGTVDYNRREGFTLTNGTVIHHQTTNAEEWKGQRVWRALSTDYVDPATGEMVAAVPLRTLTDTVPGCASDELTSSKWRVTGLREVLGAGDRKWQPDEYRTRTPKATVIRRGPGR